MRLCRLFCDRPQSCPPLSASRPLEGWPGWPAAEQRGGRHIRAISHQTSGRGTSFNARTYSKPNGCSPGEREREKEGREAEASRWFLQGKATILQLAAKRLGCASKQVRGICLLSSCSPSSLQVEPKPVTQFPSAGVQRTRGNGVSVF